MQSEIKPLLQIIEDQLGWGNSSSWQGRDFENLNQLIFEKTKVSLSASTLRRVWGRVEYKHLPSATTLDALAKFAGYDSWREFLKHKPGATTTNYNLVQSPAGDVTRNFSTKKSIAAILILMAVGLIIRFAIQNTNAPIDPGSYSLSSQRLAKGIPNSVIFNYDASASPTDSIFILQSWDPRTKALVAKNGHQHTSVYYEPGFYIPKLVIGCKIVKQHKLMIPTEGWLGLITNKPVPYYLKPSDFISNGALQLSNDPAWIKNYKLRSEIPTVKFYNVGNFGQVPLNDFSFSAMVKNEYSEGSAACQFGTTSLITDDGAIIIPLSAKGCVSELTLISVNYYVLGKTNNLSGFGANFSDWVKVSCKSAGNRIQYFINDKLAYEAQMPAYKVKIVGLGFSFQGMGAVKNISLQNGDKMIFKAF